MHSHTPVFHSGTFTLFPFFAQFPFSIFSLSWNFQARIGILLLWNSRNL